MHLDFNVDVDGEVMGIGRLASFFKCNVTSLYGFIRRRKIAKMSDETILKAVFQKYGDSEKYEVPGAKEVTQTIRKSRSTKFAVAINGEKQNLSQLSAWLGIERHQLVSFIAERRLKECQDHEILGELLCKFKKPINAAKVRAQSRTYIVLPTSIAGFPLETILTLVVSFRKYLEFAKRTSIYKSYNSWNHSAGIDERFAELESYLRIAKLPADLGDAYVSEMMRESKAFIEISSTLYAEYSQSVPSGMEAWLDIFHERMSTEF